MPDLVLLRLSLCFFFKNIFFGGPYCIEPLSLLVFFLMSFWGLSKSKKRRLQRVCLRPFWLKTGYSYLPLSHSETRNKTVLVYFCDLPLSRLFFQVVSSSLAGVVSWGVFAPRLYGKLRVQERHLEKFLESFEFREAVQEVVEGMHKKFFDIAPAGQEYFKESKTRMYHIAHRTLELALALHREPKETVRELSALGLRHVGMSIPMEFFPPFVEGAAEAVEDVSEDEKVIQAFRWSVTLLGKILARTVLEGGAGQM